MQYPTTVCKGQQTCTLSSEAEENVLQIHENASNSSEMRKENYELWKKTFKHWQNKYLLPTEIAL